MGVLVTLQLLCQFRSIQAGSICIGLDGESAYKAVFENKDPKVDAPAYDLIRANRHLLKSLPIEVKGRHIKGHQDDKVCVSKLDRWARLNVQMDAAAK